MVDMVAIARPYARAAYEFSRDKDQIKTWSDMLLGLVACVQDRQIEQLLDNPSYTQKEIAELMIAVLSKALDQHGKNFILLLALHGRLSVISWVYTLFMQYKAEDDKAETAKITTAFKASQQEIDKLQQSLERHYQCAMKVKTAVDPALIGGALIEIGDTVIDGSIKGKLAKLQQELQA